MSVKPKDLVELYLEVLHAEKEYSRSNQPTNQGHYKALISWLFTHRYIALKEMSLIKTDKAHLDIFGSCSFLVLSLKNSVQTINKQFTIRGG